MAPPAPDPTTFDILAIVQDGRLAFEALLLAASLRTFSPGFRGRLWLGEPQPGPLWPKDPRLPAGPLRARLAELGAQFLPFDSALFGAAYPQGNKIEALAALPDRPFLFLDTDTLITGDIDALPFDFDRPAASMRREGTWPQPPLYGPGYHGIWKALYDLFGLEFEATLDRSQPEEYWRRYLYFNAGWFFHRSPQAFGARFRDYARTIREAQIPELACQELDPWLDQIALPLVIHSLGGGRPGAELDGMDGGVTCHYRSLPLLYARESDRTVAALEEIALLRENRRLLRDWPQAREMVYRGGGRKARALFAQGGLPRREQALRNALRRAGLWLR